MGGVPVLLLVATLGWGILGWGIAGQLQADDRFPSENQAKSIETVVDQPRLVNPYLAMKPDPQGGAPGGGGFNFPDAMPSSLMDEAAKIRDRIDQAGRTIEDRYNQTMGNQAGRTSPNASPGAGAARSGLVPPPSTRASGGLGSNFTPPPFTGPTTDSGQRDNTWSAEAAARASAQGNPQANAMGFGQGPSANAGSAGTFGFGDTSTRSTSPPPATANQSSNSQNSNGLRSTDMFGRMPSSLAGSSSFNGNLSAGQTYATQQEQVLADQRAAQQRQTQFGQTQPLQNPFGQAQNGQSSVNQSRTTDSDSPFGIGQYGNNSSFANSNQTPPSLNDPSLYGRGSGPEPAAYREATRTNPDSRLTDTQLRNNAWSVDKNGQIFDRLGKPMPNERLLVTASIPNDIGTGQYGQYPARQQYPAGNLPSTSSPAFGNQGSFGNANASDDRFAQLQGSVAGSPTSTAPYPSSATTGYYSNAGYPNANAGYQGAGYQGAGYPSPATAANASPAMSSTDYDRLARLERENELSEARRRLLQEETKSKSADPQISTAGVGTLGGDRPPQVATDSLFKLLLMISIFGNVYLAFWLKNMRIRFRDMVTTKRLSNSSPSAT